MWSNIFQLSKLDIRGFLGVWYNFISIASDSAKMLLDLIL